MNILSDHNIPNSLRINSKCRYLVEVNEISEFKNLYRVINEQKKPIFILGQGAMCRDDAADIFNYCINFYQKISKNPDWNGFNVLQTMNKKNQYLF